MRRILLMVVVVVLAALAYGASPLIAAWNLRQALQSADAKAVEQRVDWEKLRASLRGLQNEVEALVTEMEPPSDAARQGLWDRIKKAAAPFVVGNAVDRAVTPGGLVQLYAMRQAWQERVRPNLRLVEPPTILTDTPLAGSSLDKALSALNRLERAAFVAPTRFELEVRDRYNASRRFRASMELSGFTWRLAGIRVLRDEAPATAQPAPAS